MQGVPLAPGTEDEEDGIYGPTILDAGSAAPEWMRFPGGSTGWIRAHSALGIRHSRRTCAWSSLMDQAPVVEKFFPTGYLKNSLLG
jgi:hypothetical protein